MNTKPMKYDQEEIVTDVKRKISHLSVQGMHCASCVSKIENAVKTLKGVEEAEVNFNTREASILFLPDQIPLEKILSTIQALGYQATLIQSEEEWIETEKKQFQKEQKSLYRQLSLAVFFTLLIVILSMPDFFPFVLKIPENYRNLLQFVLATPLQFYVGRRFLNGLARFFLKLRADMESLIGLGTLTAYLYSSAILFLPLLTKREFFNSHLYFETQSAIITFILLGYFLESKARRKTNEALLKLASLQVKKVHLLRNRKEIDVDLSKVEVGDLIAVKPGERIPVDGVVDHGSTYIDESMMTGEALPVEKIKGSTVFAGTLNRNGFVVIETRKTGNDTTLSKLVHLVREAIGTKAPIAKLADQVSAVFVPIVLIIAILTFAGWFFLGGRNLDSALLHFISVLIVACPCALGLATPTALSVGMGKGASSGILFRSGESLEKLASIEAFLFDKTGTLTEGNPTLIQTILPPDSPIDPFAALQIASSIEKGSEHHLALAFLKETEAKKKTLFPIDSFEAIPGKGIRATLQKEEYLLGGEAFLKENLVLVSPFFQFEINELERIGATIVLLASEQKVIALFAIQDRLRPEAVGTIRFLKNRHYPIGLITGDRIEVGKKVASELGIDQVFGEVLPTEKAETVKKWQKEIGKVAMVGDGINDAPALAVAEIGIALASGTDLAREAADITLLKGSIGLIPTAIELAEKTLQTIRQNLFFSFFYNLLLIPIAAGVLEPLLKIHFSPVWGSMAMAASSVTVVVNSLRIKMRSNTLPPLKKGD